MATEVCVFCDIINGRIKVSKVWDSAQVVAFKDASPAAETHLLVVPKEHVGSFQSLDNPDIWDAIRQAAQRLITDFSLGSGYKLILNGGKYQHIPHLHWHLLGGELKASP